MSLLKISLSKEKKSSKYRVHFNMLMTDGEYTSGCLSYDYKPKISTTVEAINQLISN